jgi:hypothetical protein
VIVRHEDCAGNVLQLVKVGEVSLASSRLVQLQDKRCKDMYRAGKVAVHMDRRSARWGLHSDASLYPIHLLRLMSFDAVYFGGDALILVSDADGSRISLSAAT